MHYAAIDIGSNTILLLIAKVGPSGEIIPILEKAEITRLGERLDTPEGSLRTLQPEAIDRTLKVLLQYTDLCHRNGVKQIACVATEAMRRGNNAGTLIQQAQEQCGFKIEVITGKKEAELAYISAMIDFQEKHPNLVVVDIGGGSTEVIWQTGQDGDIAKLQAVSLKMGAVRLTERFFAHDPIREQEYNSLVWMIENRLEQDLSSLPFPHPPLTLIGMAGTVTTLASIHQKLKIYDSQRMHASVLPRKALEQILAQLASKTLEERKRIVGMEPKRADVLLAGGVLLNCILKKFGVEELIVSDHGIRYGLFYQRFVQC